MDIEDSADLTEVEKPQVREKHRRRVLIYGINYAPEPIGVGKYSGEMATHLSNTEHFSVTVVTAVPHYPGWKLRDGYRNIFKTETVQGVRVTRCPLLLNAGARGLWRLLTPLSFASFSAPAMIFQVLINRPHTIVCVEPTLACAPLTLLMAFVTRARAVLYVQDLEVDAAFSTGHLRGRIVRRTMMAFERWLLRKFDFAITISLAMKKKLEAKGVSPARINIVRNWVDLEQIRRLSGPNSYRRELGIAEADFVVQYSGNIGIKQALHIVLAAAEMLRKCKEVIFVIAGEGPEKSRLQSLYGQLPNVQFLGLQPEARFCEFLNLADLHVIPQDAGTAGFVLPSKLGGILASGKRLLVMSDRDTELGEFLGSAATIIPPGDVAGLAHTIMALRVEPDLGAGQRASLAKMLDRNVNLAALSDILMPQAS